MTNLVLLKFGVQVFFSSVVLGLCIYQLTANDASKDNQALYWGGVTAILAWWMPSPKTEKDDGPGVNVEQPNIETVNMPVNPLPSSIPAEERTRLNSASGDQNGEIIDTRVKERAS